jgi:hypothetical protein
MVITLKAAGNMAKRSLYDINAKLVSPKITKANWFRKKVTIGKLVATPP